MSQTDELRAGIAGGRAALRVALRSAATAAGWETARGTAADGEAGWSPRQVAEHAIPAEIMLAGKICAACGCEGPASPLAGSAFATPAEALAALEAVGPVFDEAVSCLQDADLDNVAAPGADGLDGMSVGTLLEACCWHLADHSAQIMNPFT